MVRPSAEVVSQEGVGDVGCGSKMSLCLLGLLRDTPIGELDVKCSRVVELVLKSEQHFASLVSLKDRGELNVESALRGIAKLKGLKLGPDDKLHANDLQDVPTT